MINDAPLAPQTTLEEGSIVFPSDSHALLFET